MSKTAYRPEGFHTVTPYLIAKDAAKLIEFLQAAFDAQVKFRMDQPDGKVAHAELQIGDSVVELSEGSPKYPAMPTGLHIYVPDVDDAHKRAVAAGGISRAEPVDQFYGERSSDVEDPSGNRWFIATKIRDLSPEELQKLATSSKS